MVHGRPARRACLVIQLARVVNGSHDDCIPRCEWLVHFDLVWPRPNLHTAEVRDKLRMRRLVRVSVPTGCLSRGQLETGAGTGRLKCGSLASLPTSSTSTLVVWKAFSVYLFHNFLPGIFGKVSYRRSWLLICGKSSKRRLNDD